MQSEKRLFLILVILVPLLLLTLFFMKFAPSDNMGEPSFQPSKTGNDATREYI